MITEKIKKKGEGHFTIYNLQCILNLYTYASYKYSFFLILQTLFLHLFNAL